MIIIGVTGGMGAGKSRVLAHLEEKWNARTIRLDDISRELLARNGLCYEETIRIFGERIVKLDGNLDRALIAKMIFEDSQLRDRLNNLVHPAVKAQVRWIAEEMRQLDAGILVVEAALLIEGGYREICDELWYIYADEDIRRERLRESRGYTDERINGTFATQLTDEVFRSRVDFVVDNSGSFEDTARAIDSHLKEILANERSFT
ncbi:MAG: dephospho-CoA kinase [Lachnospiraceae bacterium]|nr:dephospho-CoA kinase [Lachnospiraceae bacterium]